MKEARFHALSLLENLGPTTAGELADVLGGRREAMAMLLMRARRDGLVDYRRRSRRHRLSDRGRARLAWLRGRRA
jgi:DNA-binding transcriptional ArsR family regulator